MNESVPLLSVFRLTSNKCVEINDKNSNDIYKKDVLYFQQNNQGKVLNSENKWHVLVKKNFVSQKNNT